MFKYLTTDFLSKMMRSFTGLLYPELCEYCQDEIRSYESPFCIPCSCKLPHTNFEKNRENDFTDHFYGRIKLEYGIALFYLNSGGSIERMLYRLKYKGAERSGVQLGKYFGEILSQNLDLKGIDFLVPVPLHPRKLKKRKYNQSERLAKGLSKVLKIPVREDIILRTKFTKTQTRMNRYNRIKNTEDAFILLNKKTLKNKHFVLVDDVLTTGATLEACARKLQDLENVKISMLTLAIGRM